MPTLMRTSPSEIPSESRTSAGTEACVIIAGCSTRDSTPPRDSAREKSFRDSKKMRDSARPPFEDYRDHAAEIAHLPAGYRVLWMVSTTRIDNLFDTRMNCQIVYDAPGICTVAFHANVKRFCRPQEQEAVPRRRNRAMKRHGRPKVIVTDRLRSYRATM